MKRKRISDNSLSVPERTVGRTMYDLPSPIVLYIAGFLGMKSILKYSMSCKKIQKILSDLLLSKKLTRIPTLFINHF